ncbi:MAG: glycoside hydrolase family 32 protein [Chloroflexi bacterium]|nr:glycoside hydrolase family 32 protein [Chloroflexota bacterium]
MSVFYKPADGFVGDVIPFYWEGVYHAFYLKAPLPPLRDGANHTPYAHLASRDLVHWEELPLAIEPGPPGAPDSVSCFTGALIERDGIFYLFYTGFRGEGKPQSVCLATSADLIHWEKDPRNPIIEADSRWYETVDWRDPYPFWNEEAGEYWMLLAAREQDGPANRRGCIALMTSPDLETWEVKPPFWSPRLYYTHECPDLFRWGGYWVLVYSTFSERNVTHYRLSKSLAGPWLAPENDTFDGRAFYAAKTAGASNSERRYVFGWNPTREDECDEGRWQWAGHLIVHELRELTADGIRVAPPDGLSKLFAQNCELHFKSEIGDWRADSSVYAAEAVDSFAACTLGALPASALIEARITAQAGTRGCGLLLRCAADLERYYQIRWEPGRGRVVVDRWPRPGDEPFMLERAIPGARHEQLRLQVFVDGSVLVVYINDALALNCRMYDHAVGQLGLFVSEGGAAFDHITLRTLPP